VNFVVLQESVIVTFLISKEVFIEHLIKI